VDALELLPQIPDKTVNLIVTSPPFALHFKKEYGNVAKAEYVPWFLRFAREFFRILTDDGSLVIGHRRQLRSRQPTALPVSI